MDSEGNTTDCTAEITQEECDDDDGHLIEDDPNGGTSVQLRPNPTKDQDVELLISVKTGQASNKHSIQVSNLSGRMLINETVELKEGDNVYVIPNHLLINGIHFVRIQDQHGNVITKRFVKINE